MFSSAFACRPVSDSILPVSRDANEARHYEANAEAEAEACTIEAKPKGVPVWAH